MILWRRKWQLTSVFLPGKSHGQRSLVGCSPWCHKESDTTERLHLHFLMDCRGKGRHWKCRLGQLMEALGSFWWTWTLPLAHGGFPCGSAGKESTCNVGDLGSIPGLGRFPWRRERLPTAVFWPGEFHGLYSPWGHKSQTRLSDFQFHLAHGEPQAFTGFHQRTHMVRVAF